MAWIGRGGASLPFAHFLLPPDGRDVYKNALILSDSNIVRIFLNEDVFIVIAQPDQEIMLSWNEKNSDRSCVSDVLAKIFFFI